MTRAEIWSNVSGLWFGRVVDPATGVPDGMVLEARSRGSIIAEIRCRYPRRHLLIEDKVEPTDP